QGSRAANRGGDWTSSDVACRLRHSAESEPRGQVMQVSAVCSERSRDSGPVAVMLREGAPDDCPLKFAGGLTQGKWNGCSRHRWLRHVARHCRPEELRAEMRGLQRNRCPADEACGRLECDS